MWYRPKEKFVLAVLFLSLPFIFLFFYFLPLISFKDRVVFTGSSSFSLESKKDRGGWTADFPCLCLHLSLQSAKESGAHRRKSLYLTYRCSFIRQTLIKNPKSDPPMENTAECHATSFHKKYPVKLLQQNWLLAYI